MWGVLSIHLNTELQMCFTWLDVCVSVCGIQGWPLESEASSEQWARTLSSCGHIQDSSRILWSTEHRCLFGATRSVIEKLSLPKYHIFFIPFHPWLGEKIGHVDSLEVLCVCKVTVSQFFKKGTQKDTHTHTHAGFQRLHNKKGCQISRL